MSLLLVSRMLLALSIFGAGLAVSLARAHEVLPAIADFTVTDGKLVMTVKAPVEGFIAGIDLSTTTDTNASPLASTHDALRQLPSAELEARFQAFWPEMAARMNVTADGTVLPLQLTSIDVSDQANTELARPAQFQFSAEMPQNARRLIISWDAAFGTLVLRQQGVEAPYTGFLEAGAPSEAIDISGGGAPSAWQSFLNYIPIGFDHILPKGLDHILFVLGLFFFSTKLRPLLWQITAFTVAHTLTLGMSSLGVLSIPTTIVEPLIAASIVFVAIENIWNKGELKPWRPILVFGFGLLHGLGFAAVLNEFGLPEGTFIPALIGFNIGVELGQLTIIAVSALLFWTWAAKQSWYRKAIAVPASLAIAAVGAFWVVERTLL